jgi:hypothetical protein
MSPGAHLDKSEPDPDGWELGEAPSGPGNPCASRAVLELFEPAAFLAVMFFAFRLAVVANGDPRTDHGRRQQETETKEELVSAIRV